MNKDLSTAFSPIIAVKAALITLLLLFVIFVPVASAVESNSTTTSTTTSTTSTTGTIDDLTGDHLILQSLTHGFGDVQGAGGLQDRIAVRGTKLRVTHVSTASSTGDKTVSAVVETVPCIVISLADGKFISRRDRTHVGVGGLVDCPTETSDIAKLVKQGEAYNISKHSLDLYGYLRSGWTYGALLVPYKYHFDDKSFTGASTLGLYLGYRLGGFGIETELVTSFGLSSLSVANPNGSGNTSTIQGFTGALGILGGVNKNENPLRLGILVGVDYAGSNSAVPYKHEGKPWVAAQVGFGFTK